MTKIGWKFTWDIKSNRYYDTPEEALMAIQAGSDIVSLSGTLCPLFAVKVGGSDIKYRVRLADAFTYNTKLKKWLSEPCLPI